MASAGEIVGSRPRAGLLVAAAALVLGTGLLLGAAAPAHAVNWLLPPTDISNPAGYAITPEVAVAADGTTTVAWRNDLTEEIQVATRPAGSTSFGAPRTISASGSSAYNPQIATAPDGKTTVAWQNYSGATITFQAAVRPAGQADFRAPQPISSQIDVSDTVAPDVAAAPDGTTTVVWPELSDASASGCSPPSYDMVARAATLPAGSNDFPDPSSVTPATLSDASCQPEPWITSIGVGPDGTATVAWAQAIGPGGGTIQTSTRLPGQSSWSTAQSLSDPALKSEAPSVALGQGGRAAITWQVVRISGTTIEAATRASGTGTFGASQPISDPSEIPAFSPTVAFGPAGEAVAVWYGGIGIFRVWTATLPAGAASFDPATEVPPGGAQSSSIAIAPDGEQTMVWDVISGSTSPPNYTIQATSRAGTTAAWPSPMALDSFVSTLAPDPSVVVAPNGAATAVWTRTSSDGSTRKVQAVSSPPTTYDLNTATSGDGSGTITSSPAGISCGSTCSAAFELSSSVTLTATPDKGSSFGGWGGACSGSAATCTVSILGNRSATATFTKDAPTPGPGPTPGPTPSNRFSIASTRSLGSTAVTRVRVPGAGKLSQRGSYRTRGAGSSATRTACTVSRTARKAGTYTLKCRLNAAARRQREKGKLRVAIRTTFTPTGGTARSSLRTIVFSRLKPRHTG